MDAFEKELKDRLPLATAVLETLNFAFPDGFLNAEVWNPYRGRCYDDTLNFPTFVRLIRDALLEHGGSGHRACVESQRRNTLPVDDSSVYRKLAHIPVDVSRAMLRRGTARLTELVGPQITLLPACFEDFEVVAMDGKKVKGVARRLKPTREFAGALLGAKAMVAMSLRTGLALAMSDSLDGEANDVPLVPALLPQVREVVDRPILWLADRQFADYHIPGLLQQFGDHFAIRVRKGLKFQADPAVRARPTTDDEGRTVIDETGSYGNGKNSYRVRRITLRRGAGLDDVVVITDLTDRGRFSALDLLRLYAHRWGIEMMFQQVTETFGLKHLIGCQPQAVLFQFAFCLLIYNLIQVLKAYVAEDGKVERGAVSTANLFYDVKRELQTWSYLALPAPASPATDAAGMRSRLRQLLRGSWDAVAYLKVVSNKKRHYPPKKTKCVPGAHTSVQRLLEEANS